MWGPPTKNLYPPAVYRRQTYAEVFARDPSMGRPVPSRFTVQGSRAEALDQPLTVCAAPGRRCSRSQLPMPTTENNALAAHNISARSGRRRCGARDKMKVIPRLPGGTGPGVEVIRHATTSATKSATAAADAITG